MKPVIKNVLRILILLFLLPEAVYAQQAGTAKDTTQVIQEDKIFESVDIEASFPGGDEAWRKYLEQNVNGAVAADYGAPAGSYTVVIQFVVDKEGKISEIKPLTRHGYGMEAEVIRIIRKSPRWVPASQNGRMVRAYRKQPVTFTVIADRKRGKKNKD